MAADKPVGSSTSEAEFDHGADIDEGEGAVRSRENTTTRILDAAEELFSRRDPANVTIREIAEAAGVTHPLVHQYVGSKAQVIDAVIRRGAPHRHLIMEAHPDLNEVVPLLLDDIMSRTVHSRAIVRSAMDGVEYAPLDDRIKSGQMLIGLANAALAQGASRPAPAEAMDPRIVLAAMTALAYGWVATSEWLVQIFDLEGDSVELQAQLAEICVHIVELIYAPERESE